jgi:hypothetical protein
LCSGNPGGPTKIRIEQETDFRHASIAAFRNRAELAAEMNSKCEFPAGHEIPGRRREIDLLSRAHAAPIWLPRAILGEKSWKNYSGKWQAEDDGRIVYLPEHEVRTGENIAVIGSTNWEDYRVEAAITILTDSAKPPEGGAILYHHFRNMKNYRSFHLCIFKKQIEIIDRVEGIWEMVAVQDYGFELHRRYTVTVCSSAGRNCYFLDGVKLLETNDRRLMRGCVAIGIKFCMIAIDRASVVFMEKPCIC